MLLFAGQISGTLSNHHCAIRMRWLNIESLVTVGQLPSLSDLLGCTTEYTPKFKGLGHNCRGLETHQVLMPYNKTEDNFDKMSLETKKVRLLMIKYKTGKRLCMHEKQAG